MLSDSLISFMKISVARVLAALGMFLLSVSIGQNFGPQGLGEFTLWLSIAIAFGLISRLGLDGCLLKLAAVENDANKNYPLHTAYWRSVSWSLLSSLGAIASIVVAMRVMAWPLSSLAIWMMLSIPGLTLLGIVAGYQRGRNNNTLVALIDVGGVGAVTFLGLLTSVQLGLEDSLDHFALFFFLASSLMAIMGILLCARDMSKRSHLSGIGDLNQRKSFHKDQFHFATVVVVGFLMQAGSFPLAAYSLDNETIGILRAAERLTTLIVFPTISINLILVSQLSAQLGNSDKTAISGLVRKSILSCFIISAATSLPLIAFSEYFLGLFGTGFVEAKNELIGLAIAQILLATISPFISYLSYAGQGKRATKITLQTAVFGVISFPLLSYYYGGVGFVFSYLAVSLLKTILVVRIKGALS